MNKVLDFSTNLLWKLCGGKSYHNKERLLIYERGLLCHANTYREIWNCAVSQKRGVCVCFTIPQKTREDITMSYPHQLVVVEMECVAMTPYDLCI